MGPWNLFELDKFTVKKLKGMVDMLPALPPMNYDNLNKRIGELDDYPLEIPVAIIAICFGSIHSISSSYLSGLCLYNI